MAYFEEVVKEYGPKLQAAFKLTKEDTAAVFGNLGHESGGFVALQEKRPLIAGSRGGYGWAQWTGPRRNAYEAYCEKNKLDPASNAANYAYLVFELQDDYKRSFPDRVTVQHTLYAKVVAFEKLYERAGIKHYPSRYAWAKRALAVL